MTSVTIGNGVMSIGERAFYNCSGLTEVRSLIKEPFAINYSVFKYQDEVPWREKFTTATLYVPVGTKEKYEATVGWKNFETIIETDFKDEPKGDVNGDLVVDVADISTIISKMTAEARMQEKATE